MADIFRTGAQALTDVVGVSLGPSARNVVIERPGSAPLMCMDGVTIATATEFSGVVNSVNRVIKQAAREVAEEVGDGTTTTITLANAILQEGLLLTQAGANSVEVVAGMAQAVEDIDSDLVALSRPCETQGELTFVANISTKSQELGDIVARALLSAGKYGHISIEEATGAATTVEVMSGFTFDRGLVSELQLRASNVVELKDPTIVVCREPLTDAHDIIGLLGAMRALKQPIVFVAPSVSRSALQRIVQNTALGHVEAYAILADKRGHAQDDWLEDLAVAVGQPFVADDNHPLAEFTQFDTGQASSATLAVGQSTIIGEGATPVTLKAYVKTLTAQLDSMDTPNQERQQQRIGRLVGGAVTIRVGGQSVFDVEETKARLEDGLHAARIASQEGTLPGAGRALQWSAEGNGRTEGTLGRLLDGSDAPISMAGVTDDGAGFVWGYMAVMRACAVPSASIIDNSLLGAESAAVLWRLRDRDVTCVYDAKSGEYVEAYEAGILDPTAVVRAVLSKSFSVAKMLLLSGALLAKVK